MLLAASRCRGRRRSRGHRRIAIERTQIVLFHDAQSRIAARVVLLERGLERILTLLLLLLLLSLMQLLSRCHFVLAAAWKR